MSELIKQLTAIFESMGAKFSLSGTAMPIAEVLSNQGLLPAIAKRADQLSSLCLGYGIGVTFIEDKETKIGSKVTFDDVTPNVLRCLCILDVVNELMRNKDMSGVTPLDELIYD